MDREKMFDMTVNFRSGIMGLLDASYSIRQSLAAGGGDHIPLTEEGVRQALRINSAADDRCELIEAGESVAYTTGGGLTWGWRRLEDSMYVFWAAHPSGSFAAGSTLLAALEAAGWVTEEEALSRCRCRVCGGPVDSLDYPYCRDHILEVVGM